MNPLLTLGGFLSFSGAALAGWAIAKEKKAQQEIASREVLVELSLFNVGLPQI
jgi:hypothetical protein